MLVGALESPFDQPTPTAMAWAGRASQSDDVKANGHAGAKAGAPRGRSYPAPRYLPRVLGGVCEPSSETHDECANGNCARGHECDDVRGRAGSTDVAARRSHGGVIGGLRAQRGHAALPHRLHDLSLAPGNWRRAKNPTAASTSTAVASRLFRRSERTTHRARASCAHQSEHERLWPSYPSRQELPRVQGLLAWACPQMNARTGPGHHS